jgi:UPF0755 protein
VLRKLLLLLETLVLLAGLLMGAAAWRIHAVLEQPVTLPADQLVEVPLGASPGGMLNRLEDQGALQGAFWARLYWRFNLDGQTLHTGEYRIAAGTTVRQMLELWQRGEVVQYNLTLVEGWTFRQVRNALARQEKLKQTLASLSDEDVMARIGHPGVFPEGRFFPDTYSYVKGMSDAQLLEQAYARLDAVLAQEWQQRDAAVPYSDPYQALIMASLIEKETGAPQERGEIAGVFVRRLASGMLLQTDPTVIYGMGDRYTGRITRADLREPSPYNTYLNPGLPPTPISMVGRDAIRAALNPTPGSSLYFVAKGDGSHVFSDDIDAHNQAVRQYQLKRRADYRSSPAPVTGPGGAAEVPLAPAPPAEATQQP